MTAVAGTPPAGAAQAPPIASDLRGYSALPLLGRPVEREQPWLFVLGGSEAWVSAGPIADAQFIPVGASLGAAWAFADGAFAGVVIDAAAFRHASNRVLSRIVAEARRVTAHDGEVLVACRHRLMPREWRQWREYGQPGADRWRRVALAAGLSPRLAGYLSVEGNRVVEATLPAGERDGVSPASRRGDRVVWRVSRSATGDAAAIERIVANISAACGVALRADRIAVRKIGKTAIFAAAADGRRYVVRIARSRTALARAVRNFEALDALREAGLPATITERMPAAVVRGSHAGFHYFVETCLDGAARPPRVRGSDDAGGWAMDAVRYISLLHAQTQQRTLVDQALLDRLVQSPIAVLSAACRSVRASRTLEQVHAACAAQLAGRVMPLVWCHGDFTESNCLFDASGTLTAVVDWEVSLQRGLPLHDLLQLLPVAGERSSSPRWQRFDRWVELWREPDRALADPVMGTYLRELSVPPQTVPALVMTQWATHVAERVDARRHDERWMRLRVWQPLDDLERMLRE